MIKSFFKNGKKYLDYLMKLDFAELLVNVVEIVLLAILAGLVALPIGVFRDLFYSIVKAIGGTSEAIFNWYNVLFNFFTGIIGIALFMYLFNRRYSKLDELIKKDDLRDKKRKEKNKDNKKDEEDVEIDLPKKKD